MSINDLAEKIKPFYYLILFVVIAGVFFALGRLSAIEERHQPIKILQPASGETANVISAISDQTNATSATGTTNNSTSASGQQSAVSGMASQTTQEPTSTSGEVVASKNGTKYYFPWCGGVKLIKSENQVTFASADLARAAGYTPAANCKGLK